MWCVKADMSKTDDFFTLEFEDRDEVKPRKYTLLIQYTNEVEERIVLKESTFKGKSETITEMIQSLIVYIPDKVDSKIFLQTAQLLMNFFDYGAIVRTAPFPGKELIVFDYSTTIDTEDIKKLSLAIIDALKEKEVELQEIASEEQETEAPNFIDEALERLDGATDYTLPFEKQGDEFVDDDFNLGVVEEDD